VPSASEVACGQPPSRKEVRGAACPWRGLGVVGRGEPILPREHRRSAPRGTTVPNELTKDSCGVGARRLTDRA